jgi:hypothetical protein
MILDKAKATKGGWTKTSKSGIYSQTFDGSTVHLVFGWSVGYKLQGRLRIPAKTQYVFQIFLQLQSAVEFGGGYERILSKSFSGEGQSAKEAEYIESIRKRGLKQFGVGPENDFDLCRRM